MESRAALITAADLAREGLDENARSHANRTRERIARGAHVEKSPTEAAQMHVLRTEAAIRRRRVPHAASHISAAVVWELPLFDADLSTVHLTAARGHPGRRSGVHTHQGSLSDAETVRGVPALSLPRTLMDCARTIPRDQAVAMADFALHEEWVTRRALLDLLQPNVVGASRARTVVSLADGRSESVGESRSRLILLDAGFSVTPQVWICNAQGEEFARVDLAIDGAMVAVEFDGREKYTRDPRRDWHEKVRKEAIEDQGWVVVPVYWSHLDHPREIVERVERAIRRGRR